MKKSLVLLLLACSVLTAKAVPALPGQWKMITLANGEQVNAELCGDEYIVYWQTDDGARYVWDEALGAYTAADMETLLAKATAMRDKRDNLFAARRAKRVNIGAPTAVFQGQKRGLIILVQFKDWEFSSTNNLALYKQIANEENFTSSRGFVGSVKDYFRAQSYGQFEIDFDVVGPVTMPENYAYYGADTDGYTVNCAHMADLVASAAEAVDDEIDYTNYDWDGDGEADLVFILFAGYGQNNVGSSDTNTIWPHLSTISDMGGTAPTLDGVKVNTYACSCELYLNYQIDGIGTICHEFSHCFGLPDMYDLDNQNSYTMGRWDVLAYGNYNSNTYGQGFVPAGYSSYERWFCGWLEPIELTDDCDITDMPPLNEEGVAYVVYNDRIPDEYYLLENRNTTNWDACLSGKGLLVLHLDYNLSSWQRNYVNNTSEHRYTLIPANNKLTTNDESGHPYPYGTNNSLTNSSSPAATLYNANIDGARYMNKPITNIVLHSDSSISFSFTNENISESDPDAPESYVFYESFNKCGGKGGNDGVFEGSDLGKGTSSIVGYTDNEVWIDNNCAHAAWMCALMGGGTALTVGSITSPEITTTQDSRLIFKAAPFTGDGTTLNLSVEGDGVSLGTTTFEMTEEEWTTYSVALSGAGTFTINFSVPSGHFFLDEVYVTYELSDGIEEVVNASTVPTTHRVYSIDGRCVGTDDSSPKAKGIYIVNGKKVIL